MRNKTREEIVAEFHKATEIVDEGFSDSHQAHLRYNLMEEELKEVKHEISMVMFKLGTDHPITSEDKESLLKELCDLQYVLSGTILSFGFSDVFPAAFNRVHLSNMSKVEGGVKRRADGKILKSESYAPANLKDLVDE